MLALAMLATCSSPKDGKPDETNAPTVHELMTRKIDVDADAIWSIGNAAINDRALLEPARMDEKDWQGLEQAAQRLAGDAATLATLDPVVVTRPGVRIADEGVEGAPSPAEIQAHIKRDTDVYRSLARSLAGHSARLAAAARAREPSRAGHLINELDGVCESCHLEFWYPEQKALVEALEAGAGPPAR